MDYASLGLDPLVVRILNAKKEKRKQEPAATPAPALPPDLTVAAAVTPLSAPGPDPVLPALTPAERESMIGSLGRTAMGGLQWVGETLDKPGRALRGLLAGRPSELLDAIPFSDTIGLTTPENDVSGRDLLETWGVLGENQPGLDAGDVVGFGTEVLTDPLGWVSLGGSTYARDVAKGGAKAAEALTAAGKAKEIAEGARSLVNFHTPSLGVPLPSKIPFTQVSIPRVEAPVKELGQWGTGTSWGTGKLAQAADKYIGGPAAAYEAVQFGKYSPNPYLRNIFSPIEEVRAATIRGQKKGLEFFEDRTKFMEQAGQKAADFLEKEADASAKVASLRADQFPDFNEQRLQAVRTAYQSSDVVKEMVHREFGPKITWESLHNDPQAKLRAADIYDQITSKREMYGELADDLRIQFEDYVSALGDVAKLGDGADARWFDNQLRDMVERKGNPFSKDEVIASLRDAGFREGVPGFDAAADAMYALHDQLRDMYKTELSEAKRLGIDLDELNDYYVGYSHRRPEFPEGSAMQRYLDRRYPEGGQKKLIPSYMPFMMAREIRDLPGGTRRYNQITMDPMVTAVKHRRGVVEDMYKNQIGVFDQEKYAAAPPSNSYLRRSYDESTKAGFSWPTVKAIAQDINAQELQRIRALRDQRKMIYDEVRGIMGPEWRKRVNEVVKADGDYTNLKGFDEVTQRLRNMGLEMDDLQVFETMRSWNSPAGRKMSDEQLAAEAIKRYDDLKKQQPDDAMFDMGNDPTSFPHPSFDGNGPGYTFDNAAYYLTNKYDLPAWWRYDELVRNKLKETTDEAVAAIAKNGELSEHQFKEQLWDLEKQRQASLPDGADKWAEDVSDVDDFIIEYKRRHPELDAIPMLSQSDLHDLVRKLYHMPLDVLKSGLFNRTTTTDSVDYLLQMTKVKAGVATMRRMLLEPGGLSDAADFSGPMLADIWGKNGMGLTDQGLADFLMEWKNIPRDMDPEQLSEVLNKLKAAVKIDQDIADMAGKYVEMFKQTPDKRSWMENATDLMNSLFKAGLTIPFPAFHVRNRIGGVAANWVAGIHSSEGDRLAQSLFLGKMPIEEQEKWLREIKVNKVYSVGTGGGSNQVFDRLEQYRGVQGTRLPLGGTPQGYVFGPFKEFATDTSEAFREKGVKGGLGQLFGGGITKSGREATDLNPFGVSGAFDPIGYRNRKNAVDKFGKPLSKTEKLQAPNTTFVVFKAGTNANDYIEWMNRVGPYMALRQAGWSPTLAARKIRQVQFDYKDLSPWEKKYMRRLIPFYSFTRKNLEQQVRLLMENPGGRTAQTIRAENNANREGRSKGSYVPKYLAESFSVRLPGGDENNAKFYSQSGLLPAEEAFNRFIFDNEGFPLAVKRTAEKVLAQASPAIQGPLEQLTGKQFWSGRKLDDLFQSPTSDQDLNLYLSKLPTTRLANTVGGLFDDRKPIPLRAFNALVGGARVTDVNVAKQRALELRDILEEKLAADKDIGEYTQLYAKDLKSIADRAANGDSEAARMLRFYEDLKQELKNIKKAERKQQESQAVQ